MYDWSKIEEGAKRAEQEEQEKQLKEADSEAKQESFGSLSKDDSTVSVSKEDQTQQEILKQLKQINWAIRLGFLFIMLVVSGIIFG